MNLVLTMLTIFAALTMKRLLSIIFFFLCLNCVSVIGQLQPFYVANPLEIVPAFSGNYGELRPNHFHAGVDLKTNGNVNLPVHVVEEGFVSRIKISPYGYGKVIYVDHPQGYTTVYAHLNGFNETIEAYIKQEQYRLKSFTVDVYPGSNDLQVSKDDIIAFSGNTGGSGGPHLHFEIRETQSEIPRNPLLFDFPASDQKPPVIEAIGVYDATSQTNNRFRVSRGLVAGGNPVSVAGTFGLEVSAYDSQDGSVNRNGIYEIRCIVNGKLHSKFIADSIAFDVSRQLNALIDYGHYYRTHQRFMRLYRLPGNFLPNLKTPINKGLVTLSEGQHEVLIQALDVAGNISETTVKIVVNPKPPSTKPSGTYIDCSAYYLYESENWRLGLEPYALYENTALELKEDAQSIEFLNPFIPINYPLEVQHRQPYKSGEVLARLNNDGRPVRAIPTKRSGDWLIGESKTLGRFGVTTDTQAPSITSVNFATNKTFTQGALLFTISDNFSGIESFDATINNEWVLAEYEPKSNRLTISVSDIQVMKTLQQLKIEVVDMAGNVGTFEGSFYRK